MKKTTKYITFEQFRKETLKDPEVKREYDALAPEYALIQKMIELRNSQGLTQKQIAKKLGTKQSAISRLERGTLNPTLKTFFKLTNSSLPNFGRKRGTFIYRKFFK